MFLDLLGKIQIKIHFTYFLLSKFLMRLWSFLHYSVWLNICSGQSWDGWLFCWSVSFPCPTGICGSSESRVAPSGSDHSAHWKQQEKSMGVWGGQGQQKFLHVFIVSFWSLRSWGPHIHSLFITIIFIPYASHNCQHMGAVGKIWNKSCV